MLFRSLRHRCSHVGVAQTAEDAEMIILSGVTVELLVRGGQTDHLARSTIQQVDGRRESFSPECRFQACLKHKSTHSIVDRANSTFRLVILLRCVWARQTNMNTISEKELIERGVDELSAIVSLEGTNRAAKLCVDICEEVSNRVINIRFLAKWEVPIIV